MALSHRAGRGHGPRRVPSSRLAVESLESRLVPTLSGTLSLAGAVSAPAPGGGQVVVWASPGADSSGWGVLAQRFDALGLPQGPAFLVNTTTAGDQLAPSVAVDASGQFVVAWSAAAADGTTDVFARRFDAAGVAEGDEFRVNTTTTNSQIDPLVVMDANGEFIIVWWSSGPDGNRVDIFYQSYLPDGSALGSEQAAPPPPSGTSSTLSPQALEAAVADAVFATLHGGVALAV